ncbi:MAG: metal-dependent hydrolase [Candidatus Margulisiibacteriota bacterium]
MLAPTHSVFGIFLTLVILAFFGVQWGLHWTIILFAVLGSIIPDIDHPRSVIGKIFYPISSRLERAFGHRTITHSLIGWIIATIIFAVLIIIPSLIIGHWKLDILPWRWIASFSISYFSHLILDMFNRRGAQMFWPDPGRDVIPRDPRYRPPSGSKVEIIIFTVMVFLMFLAFPVSKYGVSSSVHWLIATPSSAIEEFKSMKTHAYIDFKGYFESTKENVQGTAEILDTDHKKLVILFNNAVYTLNEEHSADITASKVKIRKTNIPIKIEQREFTDKTRNELLSQIPDNALISGTINLPEGIDVTIPKSEGSYKTIDQKGSTLILNYANKAEMEKIGLTEKYDIQMKKDTAELAGLRAKARTLNNQMGELQSNGDLTALGRQVLSDQDTAEKRGAKLEELRSQLAETNVKIEEANLKIKARTLNFSGNVYIRQ